MRKGTKRRKLTKEQHAVVAGIAALHEKRQPLNISAVRRNHPDLLLKTYRVKPFWGWKQAIEAAGLDYRKIKVSIPRTIVCKVCGAKRMRLDQHVRFHHGLSPAQYQDRYGTRVMSSDALKTKRIDRKAARMVIPHWEPHWSPEYVLDRLYQFHRMGIPLHPSNIERQEKRLYHWTRHFFKTYDTALSALGFDPSEVRRARPKKKWTKRPLIKAVCRMKARGQDVNFKAMHRRDASIVWIAPKLFGSYDKMLKAAGLDPRKERKQPKAKVPYKTKDDVIAGICRRKLKGLGLNQKSVAKGENRDLPLYNKARRLFGTWEAAVTAAGFDYSRISAHKNPYFNRARIIEEIQRRHEQGLPLALREVRYGNEPDPRLYAAVLQLVGSWPVAVEEAGFAYAEVMPSKAKYPTKRAIIKEIKRRKRAGLPLSSGPVTRGVHADAALMMKARKLFADWREAVESAGITYDAELRQKRKYPSRESVIKEIKRRIRHGLPVNANGVAKGRYSDPSLYVNGRREFRNWQSALKAAGVD